VTEWNLPQPCRKHNFSVH